jgi:hypothetical protein
MGGLFKAAPYGCGYLHISKEKLTTAPAFQKSDLSTQREAEDIYRYFGQQPYWSEGGLFKGVNEPFEGASMKRQPFSSEGP